jgi:hypothetical protein
MDIAGAPKATRPLVVAFFIRHFTERGTEVSTFTYADENEKLLGNTSVIIHLTPRGCVHHGMPYITTSLPRFAARFRVIAIDSLQGDIPRVLAEHNIDVFYAQTHGGPDIYSFGDLELWGTCRTIKHCVFTTSCREGTVFCRISGQIACTDGMDCPILPLAVVAPISAAGGLRFELGIPNDAVVFGWLGGPHSFNIAWAIEAVNTVLAEPAPSNAHGQPIYFLFLNCATQFRPSHACLHLPCTMDTLEKSRIIQTCDAMLHAQYMGETFGLACAEFALHGKPVFTSALGCGAHRFYLGERAVVYTDASDLVAKLKAFTREPPTTKPRQCGYFTCLPERVMPVFRNVITA